LLADAERCARWLLQHFEPGEHVAVWAHNLPEWVLLEYGAALAGLTLVTVNPSLQPDEAMRACLSPQKTPTKWYAVEGFPLTGSGKIQKFAIREAWEKGDYDSHELDG
jgi:acyl-CoA synthetase (AMP-forming)/AMP-acid ligase II